MRKLLLVAYTDWYLYNFRLSLAHKASEDGFDVILVSPPGEFVQAIRDSGFRWVEWKVGRQSTAPWVEIRAIQSLFQIYRSEKPDLVHHFTVKPVLYGSLCAAWLKIPGVINTITGLGYLFLQQTRRANFLRGFARMFYRSILNRQNTAVVFENDTDRQFFIQSHLLTSPRHYLIEGVGVDTHRFIPAVEPPGDPIVVQAGRLLWDKGIAEVIDAARIVKKSNPSVRIVLVGSPDPGNPTSVDQISLDNWIKEGIVEWWGFQRDMRTIYQSCHIAILASRGEGLPTSLIEAAACGKPLIATDVSGCREVIQSGISGILVDPKKPEELAKAILTLAEDPELREKMGAASRQLAVDRFAEQKILDQNLQVYFSFIS